MRRSKVQWLVTLVIVLVFGIFVWSRLQPEKTPPKPEESSAEKEEIPENAIFISRWKYFDSKKKVIPEIEWEEEYEGKLYRGTLKKKKETIDAVGAFFVIYEAWIPEVKEGDFPKTAEEEK